MSSTGSFRASATSVWRWLCLPILVWTAGCATSGPATDPAAQRDDYRTTLRAHRASGRPVEGFKPGQDETGAALFISETTLFTQADVRDAAVVTGSKRTLVRVELAQPAAERLARATLPWAATRLAIFIDDQLVMSPVVTSPIRDGVFMLDGDFSLARATEIVRSLNAQRVTWSPDIRAADLRPAAPPAAADARETPEEERARLLRALRDASREPSTPQPEIIIEP
ncbi:MAG: hypothetical protein IPM13_13425 [Phycisphaerales bacterium]|nr:hypothetical protein [Phycisphaerales bacterium]